MKPPQLLDQVRSVVESGDDREAKGRRIAELIRNAGDYRWVGIHDVHPREIAIIAWSGPGTPAHPRFPVEQGLSGSVVRSCATVIVNDVTQDARYLTTFGGTRSEIIVPILDPSTRSALGTIDVESSNVNAFSDEDRTSLEQCAAVLPPLYTNRPSRERRSQQQRKDP